MSKDPPPELAADIAYALIKALHIPKAVRGTRRAITDDERRMMGKAIADHLMLANWRIEKGPPAEPHSTQKTWTP